MTNTIKINFCLSKTLRLTANVLMQIQKYLFVFSKQKNFPIVKKLSF